MQAIKPKLSGLRDSNVYDRRFIIHIKKFGKDIIGGMRQNFQFKRYMPWKFDFAWPEKKVAVEIEDTSLLNLNSSDRRSKQNEATVQNWRVLRFSRYEITKSPDMCIHTIWRALNHS